MSRAQYTAEYRWSCGNNHRTSNDQDKIDRLAELISKVMETDEDENVGNEGRRATDDDEEFEVFVQS